MRTVTATSQSSSTTMSFTSKLTNLFRLKLKKKNVRSWRQPRQRLKATTTMKVRRVMKKATTMRRARPHLIGQSSSQLGRIR